MDIHIIPGIKARDVAEAHRKDILLQEEHECKCMTYWIDEERENVFCLIEAPNQEAVTTMHNHAHGLVPHKIIEVNRDLVASFLGRIYDPANATTTEDGLTVFKDPSFRILLFANTKDPALLRYELGIDKANELLSNCNTAIRQQLALFNGREVEQPGADFIASFTSATNAVSCALAIQEALQQLPEAGVKIAINGGEPVATHDNLFGDTIQFARQLCFVTDASRIAIAAIVKELTIKDHFHQPTYTLVSLSLPDEQFLIALFNILEAQWQHPNFTVSEFCTAMAMSQSQFYRRTIDITSLSPNILLKQFRLEKAKALMNQKRYSIAQITFDTGFTSPSYFTKCFKKHFGLLPMAYLDLLH